MLSGLRSLHSIQTKSNGPTAYKTMSWIMNDPRSIPVGWGSERVAKRGRGCFVKPWELYLEVWWVWGEQRGGHCRQEECTWPGGGRVVIAHCQGQQVSSGSRTRMAVGCEGTISPAFGEYWATAEASTSLSVRFLRLFLRQTPLL